MKIKNPVRVSIGGATLFALFAAAALAQSQSNSIDLSKLVIVGDSLSAGFQNFSLLDTQQVHGYAALIAQQAGVNLTLPLVPAPGVPNVLQLMSPGPPPVVAPIAGTLPAIPRDNPTQQATDLAVPGMVVADVLNKAPTTNVQTAVDALTNIILGFPTPFVTPGPARTQVQTAIALNPTTIIVWIGSNDILLSVMAGDPSMQTPLASFINSYLTMMNQLASTNAHILVANIPDVTVAPYLTPTDALVDETGLPQGQVMKLLGIGPHDYLRPGALPLAFQILEGKATGPLPTICPANVPGLPITSAPCVFTASQADATRLTVDAFNLVIAGAAAVHGATLVDTHALISNLQARGYVANGLQLTTNFLGGLITLDGIHPTNTFQAILANTFIDTIDARFHSTIPAVNVDQVAAADPLVIPSLLQAAKHQNHGGAGGIR